jgi:succinate dehydrogenase/fumarate reductase flavoprotein subunit
VTEKEFKTDVLVIGAGMAGMFAAIKAREQGLSVILTDKAYVGKAGGTHFSDGDYLFFRPERGHDLDACVAVVSSLCEYLNNRDWDEICLKESEARYNDLVAWGVPFYKEDEKLYFFGPPRLPNGKYPYEDVAMVNRQYAPALRRKALDIGVRILDRVMFCDLLKHDGRIVGALGLHTTSSHLYVVHAKATVIATGTSALKSGAYPTMYWTGDGSAMAYRAGAEVAGEEIGFGAGHKPLNMGELQRAMADGAASSVVNQAAADFPHSLGGGYTGSWFCPNTNAEGSPMTDTIWEAHRGRAPLYLDMSVAFKTWTPEQHDWLRVFFKRMGTDQQDKLGLDVFKGEKIPWPASRIMAYTVFLASGVWPVDKTCRSTIPGLYSAGNSCASMVSGAAYSGMGFALNHAAVTGTRAALAIKEYVGTCGEPEVDGAMLGQVKDTAVAPLSRQGGFTPAWVTQVLQGFTVPYFVLQVKRADRLQAALTMVEFVNDHLVPKLTARDAHEWRLAHETKNMALIAEMRLRASLFREESRGTHLREDFPYRKDPEWLAWVKIAQDSTGMRLSKESVPQRWWPDLTKPESENYLLPLAMDAASCTSPRPGKEA